MSVRWFTFVLWAVVAASAVAWGLKLFVTAPPVPREARVADAGQALRGDVTRVLGADAPPPAATEAAPAPVEDARFQLVGVVAPRSPKAAREGLALIAVNGKPPKAFRVGAAVDGQTVLKAVRARGADLGPRDGAITIALQIAPPAPAATGTLPPAGGPAADVPPPPPVMAPGAAPPYGQPSAVPPHIQPHAQPHMQPPVRSKALPTVQPVAPMDAPAGSGGDTGVGSVPPEAQAQQLPPNSNSRLR
jgi:general secretion pathway protein C